MEEMPRVQALWELAAFRRALREIDEAEVDRVFCRHGLGHLLDVARIAWILNLERGWGLDREVVYAAALLHDIGRAAQYATGEPHDAAGGRMAAEMLDELPGPLGFSAGDREAVLAAVRAHRGSASGLETGDSRSGSSASVRLASVIREADGRSRPCFACSARDECYWPRDRKNLSLGI